jgi:predicted ATPase
MECDALDQLVSAVCSGESRALVLSGEAGVGKTALMELARAQLLHGERLRREPGSESCRPAPR